jgi:glycosyltransferase involved in cell wall biosynthesis
MMARMICAKRDSAMNPRPIIVYFNGTFIHRQNGAHNRASDLLDFLLDCGCQVVLYSFSNHLDCPWGDAEIAAFARKYPTVRLVVDRRSRLLVYWTKFKKLISGAAPSLTPMLAKARLPYASPQYDRLTKQLPNALYVVNYTNGLLELNGIEPRNAVIETHDLDFVQFTKRYGFGLTSPRIICKFRTEFSLLDAAKAIIAIAWVEASIFRLFLPPKPVFFIPDYGSREGRLRDVDVRSSDYDLLFVGSDNVLNARGIVDFMKNHQGFLSRYSMAIAGNVCRVAEVEAAAALLPNVRLLGFVTNLDELYNCCKIVISPVEGTGLKIKVIEALAAGKPVFGSQHSVSGLPPGADGCVFLIDEPKMSQMLLDPALLASAARAARNFAENLSSSGDVQLFKSFLRKEGTILSSKGPAAFTDPQSRKL